MTGRDEVDRLLYDGEEVEELVDVGRDRLVVTSHRVLAFTPTGDGSRFDSIHRPNVTGVERRSGGATRHLERAAKAGVLGVFLLIGGVTVDLGGLIAGGGVDPATASQVGVGEVLGLLGVLQAVLALVDDALLVGGVASIGVAALALTLYRRSRHTDVVVRVAGGDDVHLSADDATDASLTRLRRALGLRDPQ